MLTLYFAPGSSSMAPHIALYEIGCAFEARPMSFHAKAMREADYLAINPVGQVPTLMIDGRPLTEVAAILYYLAKAHPEAGLLPGDLEGEAQALSWMSYCAATLHPARRSGLEAAMDIWGTADRRFCDREWVVGRYSVADIHMFRLFWRFNASLKPPADAFPNLLAHHARMMKRPAVIRTIAAESAVGYELPG
jgi:glutathione S-transferase